MTKRQRRQERRAAALGSLARFQGVPEHVSELYGERARAIREAAAAGASVSEIARELGVARTVVYDAIRNSKGAR